MFARAALRVLPVVATAACLGAGCSKSVEVDAWVLPEADIGSARQLVLTDAYGRDESVAAVLSAAERQANTGAAGAWFTDVRVSRERLETAGRDAWIGRDTDLAPGALFVRIDVLEDSAIVTQNERVETAPDGTVAVFVDEQLVAHTLVSLTVADSVGVILSERAIEGVHEQSGPISDFDIARAQDTAADAAVAGAFALITPVLTKESIPLDDRDPEILKLTEQALAGSDSAAATLADNDRAPATYNLGAIADHRGDLETAVALYEEALRRPGGADFYATSLASAEQRLAAKQALGL